MVRQKIANWISNIADGRVGYSFRKGMEAGVGNHEYNPALRRKDFGLMPWEDSSTKNYGFPDTSPSDSLKERVSYGAGRVAGTLASDNLRSWYWRYNHPLGVASDLGSRIPKAAGLTRANGAGMVLPSVLSGFALATALDITSGNTDPTNFNEGGRPKGYAAALPSIEDPTKSQNLALEIPFGYITGRKGKLLPYDQFVEERPDIGPEKYLEYTKYQEWGRPGLFGVENANPLATAAAGAGIGALSRRVAGKKGFTKAAIAGSLMGAVTPVVADLASRTGILKGTWSNLDSEPEVQLLGYKVPLSGVIGTAAAAGGLYAGARAYKNRGDRKAAAAGGSAKESEKVLQGLRRSKSDRQRFGRDEEYQKSIDMLSPDAQRAFGDELREIEAEELFRDASPEIRKRVMDDEIRRQHQRVARGIKPTSLTPEDEARVAEAVRNYRERKGSGG
jgi:hypothetical protein